MSAPILSFVFLDLETTGLHPWSKITELCLIAIQTKHLLKATPNHLPRILNKLSLCFNPMKVIDPVASEITGLYNDALENAAPFSESTVKLLNEFLSHLPQPVCLVAHNGHKFDFPILRKHINKYQLLQSVFTVDTLQLFRQQHNLQCAQEKLDREEKLKNLPSDLLDDECDDVISQQLDELDPDEEFVKRSLRTQLINETTPTKSKEHMEVGEQVGKHVDAKKKLNFGKTKMPSFKLGDVYERLTGLPVENSHEAESDVIMLAKWGKRLLHWLTNLLYLL